MDNTTTATYYSPSGNPEVWEEGKQPAGYVTPEEWQAAHPAPKAEPRTVDEARVLKTREINAAAWAADDAEGYAELLSIHAARRETLLAAVAAAQTAAEVEAVPVTFNV